MTQPNEPTTHIWSDPRPELMSTPLPEIILLAITEKPWSDFDDLVPTIKVAAPWVRSLWTKIVEWRQSRSDLTYLNFLSDFNALKKKYSGNESHHAIPQKLEELYNRYVKDDDLNLGDVENSGIRRQLKSLNDRGWVNLENSGIRTIVKLKDNTQGFGLLVKSTQFQQLVRRNIRVSGPQFKTTKYWHEFEANSANLEALNTWKNDNIRASATAHQQYHNNLQFIDKPRLDAYHKPRDHALHGDYSYSVVPYEAYNDYNPVSSFIGGGNEMALPMLAMAMIFIIGLVMFCIGWIWCVGAGYYVIWVKGKETKRKGSHRYEPVQDVNEDDVERQ
eukprot:117885_1